MPYIEFSGSTTAGTEIPDQIHGSGDMKLNWWLQTITAATYTVTANDLEKQNQRDALIVIDATSNNVDITLPPVTTVNGMRPFRFFRVDASGNTVTIAADGSDTIEGAASITLPSQYDKAELGAADSGLWARWI